MPRQGGANGRKVAFVTAGAGIGIGGTIVRRLAREGMDVVITDAHARRCVALAEELSQEHGRPFRAIPLDVTDHEAVGAAVERAVAECGRIDVLVNNAGWNKIEPVSEMSPETWHQVLATTLHGTFYSMRHVLPHMKAQGGGAIVNIAAASGWIGSDEHGAAYSAAKAGVMALTRVAAAEAGRDGVRVNSVAPGLIYNDFLRRIYPDEFFASYAKDRTPVGRIGQPEDVAALVSFLVGDEAGYITGEVYGISGGEYTHA